MLVRYETEDGFEEGYIKNEYLTSTESLYTAKEVINVRAEADIDSEKLGEIAGGRPCRSGYAEWLVGNPVYSREELTEAYVKSEFLEKSGESLEAEKERLMDASVEEENETEPGQKQEQIARQRPEQSRRRKAERKPGRSREQSRNRAGDRRWNGSRFRKRNRDWIRDWIRDMELSEGARGQFELARALYPEMDTVGMICRKETKMQNPRSQNTRNWHLSRDGASDGRDCEEMDIDIAASELAGSTDGIFCIDDER